MAVIAGLHVLAVAGLLQNEGVQRQLAEAAPVFVRFITPPPAAPPPPSEAPPPQAQKLPPPKPQPITRTVAAPAAYEAPQPEPEPQPVLAEAPPAPPAPSAPPAEPEPVIPPNFVAAYLNNPAPAYPTLSKRLREQGKVLLRVQVSAEGRAGRVQLSRSSGYERLDAAAIAAVEQWRFVPARQGDDAVAAWVLVPIDFELQS